MRLGLADKGGLYVYAFARARVCEREENRLVQCIERYPPRSRKTKRTSQAINRSLNSVSNVDQMRTKMQRLLRADRITARMTGTWMTCVCVLMMGIVANCCYIGNQDSGECVKARYVLEGKLDFCGPQYSWFENHPEYEVCVPRDTADSRAAGLTVQRKDTWVKETYQRIVEERKEIEKEYEDKSRNEHGIPGETAQRFRETSDCEKAYKNFFCWVNFPRCNKEGASMMLCRSVCENYMISCGYDYDLWRCGKERYMNGHTMEREDHTDPDTGYPVYLRDFFPGHPFRSSRSIGENKDAPICTPGIYGSASTLRLGNLAMMASIALCILFLVS